MHVAVVGPGTALGRLLSSALCEHTLATVPAAQEQPTGNEPVDLVPEGADVLVHLGVHTLPSTDLAPEAQGAMVGSLTQHTHELLASTTEAGVGRVVLCSTVDVMTGHDPRWRVNEMYRSRPPADPVALAALLLETMVSEWAFEQRTGAMCLRLGHLCIEEEVGDSAYDSLWLDTRDAAEAIRWAIEAEGHHHHWTVAHVVHDSKRPRLDTHRHWRRRAHLPTPSHDFADYGNVAQEVSA